MKILLITTLYAAALVAGVLLGRAGALDMTGAFILIIGGGLGAAVFYPYALPRPRSRNKK